MNREPGELAELLTAWRRRLSPADLGMPAGSNRKVAGLRRAEVAVLSHISMEYLERLEQGRASNPSLQVLEALARTLQLSREERRHMMQAAGLADINPGLVPTHLSPGVVRILRQLATAPAAVFDSAWTWVAGNEGWFAIFGDTSARTGLQRNLAYAHFVGEVPSVEFQDNARLRFEDALVSDLRVAASRYPRDAFLAELIADLKSSSATFASRWARGVVTSHTSDTKTLLTTAGPIHATCDVLLLPDGDMRLVAYSCRPGSDDAERLQLAVAVGQQVVSD